MSQGPKFFDNEIVQPSNWEFWRDSNETNIKNNFLVLTDGYPGVAAGWSIVNNGPDISISQGFGYDGNGERLETFSGVNFTPLSGTNVVYARLALSDYNPQLGSGSTVTAVDIVTGLNLPVETYNTVEFTNISGAAYIPIACVSFSGGAVQSFSVASGCRNHLLMFDGSIDVYNGTINLANTASGSIPCSALASPFICNLIMNSGASIYFNQSGTSVIGTPAFPAASISAMQGNFHILSGLSPILLNSSITQNNAYSIETDASAGARLKLDTLNRGVNVGGPLYANNLRNLSGPMSLISNNYLTINSNTGMAISTSNDMAISMPNTLTLNTGSYSFRKSGSGQQMANISPNLTSVYNDAEFSSGISFATAGTSDIGSVAKPAKAVYANNLYIGGVGMPKNKFEVLSSPAGSGNWTVPSNVSRVLVEMIGGGAGGASNSGPFQPGGFAGGGGAGARRVQWMDISGSSVPYYIGSGGIAGVGTALGGSGIGTWFLSSGNVANPGYPADYTGVPGIGGAAPAFSSGVYGNKGGNGGSLIFLGATGQLVSMKGGSSFYSEGPDPIFAGIGPSGTFGAGGAGGVGAPNSVDGGKGGDGLIIIHY